MDFSQTSIFVWLSQYVYNAPVVYAVVFGMMMLSAFGLPIPEEVTILTVGLLAYMGAHPDLFPPPADLLHVRPIHGVEAAIIVSFFVLLADCIVFMIGRVFGEKVHKVFFLRRLFSASIMGKVNQLTLKYGSFAAFIFRFTPGLRFPGHIVLGMSNFSLKRFLTIDALAIAISVPTQILLLYHFGEPILASIFAIKEKLLIAGGIILLCYLIYRFLIKPRTVSENPIQ
jgi:membrane protein DedA with SNARE-associated domain